MLNEAVRNILMTDTYTYMDFNNNRNFMIKYKLMCKTNLFCLELVAAASIGLGRGNIT